MAFEREWPNPEFIKEVEEAFPDQGIANVEEARVGLSQRHVLRLLHFYSSDVCHVNKDSHVRLGQI